MLAAINVCQWRLVLADNGQGFGWCMIFELFLNLVLISDLKNFEWICAKCVLIMARRALYSLMILDETYSWFMIVNNGQLLSMGITSGTWLTQWLHTMVHAAWNHLYHNYQCSQFTSFISCFASHLTMVNRSIIGLSANAPFSDCWFPYDHGFRIVRWGGQPFSANSKRAYHM